MNSRLVRLNVVSGVIGQFITIILNFLIRSICIRYLGSENVGLNGLYLNVLGVLSVAELGIGSAIVAHMYKPIADGDSKRIKLLMNIYRKVYKTIAWFLLVMGFILLPFISEVTKTYNGYYNVHVIFLMYVLNSFISFYIGYKQSIVIANEKSYVINKVTMMLFLPIALCQIISLVVCQSFYLYMTLILINTLSLNIIIARYAKKTFSKQYFEKKEITKSDVTSILDYVKPMVMYRISGVVNSSTDSLIIAQFISVLVTGLYTNYMMIVTAAQTLIRTGFSMITASIGRMINVADKEAVYKSFTNIINIGFIISFIAVVNFMGFVNGFVHVWAGPDSVLPTSTVLLLAINLYLTINSMPLVVYREATGCFVIRRYIPLIGAFINIGLSLALVVEFKIEGILAATAVARILTYFWSEPNAVIVHFFNRKILWYFVKYFVNAVCVFTLGYIYMYAMVDVSGVSELLLKTLILIVVQLAMLALLNRPLVVKMVENWRK